MPLRIDDLKTLCPRAMIATDSDGSWYIGNNAEALACCGTMAIYRHRLGDYFVAKCPADHGGIFTKHLREVEGGVEIVCPYTGASDGVYTKAYKLLRALNFSCLDWTKALFDSMEADTTPDIN